MKIIDYIQKEHHFQSNELRVPLFRILNLRSLESLRIEIYRKKLLVASYSTSASFETNLNSLAFVKECSDTKERIRKVVGKGLTLVADYVSEFDLTIILFSKGKKRLLGRTRNINDEDVEHVISWLALRYCEQSQSVIKFREDLLPSLGITEGAALQKPLEILLETLGCSIGTMWQYNDAIGQNEQPAMLALIAAAGKHHLNNYSNCCLSEGKGLVWIPLQSKSSQDIVFVEGIEEADLANKATFGDYKGQTLVFIKLTSRKKPLGVVCLVGISEGQLDRKLRHLKIFQDFSAVVIKQLEAERKQKILQDLPDLFAVGRYDIQTLSELFVEFTRKIVNAEGASIFLKPNLDSQKSVLELSAVDISQEKLASVSTKKFKENGSSVTYNLREKSLTSAISLSAAPLVCQTIENHPFNSHTYRETNSAGHDSWIGVPLLNSIGEVIGVLRCIGKKFKIDNFELKYVFSGFDLFVLKYTATLFTKFVDTLNSFDKLESLTKRLEIADKIRAHELAAPLAAIVANADFVKKHLNDKGVTSKERRLGEIMSDADISALLIRDCRIPNKNEFQRGLVYGSVGILVREVHSFLKRQIDARQKIVFNANGIVSSDMELVFRNFMNISVEGSAPNTSINKLFLQRALYNLGINAIKYGKLNGNMIIRLNSDSENENVYIDFEDDGIGILDHDTNSIFEEGRRGSNIENQPGEGLGLSLAKLILEAHGGKLLLKSRISPTIFRCVLPILKIRQDEGLADHHQSIAFADLPNRRYTRKY